MKQLFLNGDASQMFFKGDTPNLTIMIWVEDNLDKFELNEEHSCQVFMSRESSNFEISGDEDLLEVVVKEVEVLC